MRLFIFFTNKRLFLFQQTTTLSLFPSPPTPTTFFYSRILVMEVNDFTPNLIGLLASRCSTEFYSLPQTEQYLLQSIHSLPVVPVFRLRNWLRRCWWVLSLSVCNTTKCESDVGDKCTLLIVNQSKRYVSTNNALNLQLSFEICII